MSKFKYNFYAWVSTPKQDQAINLVSIGVWDPIVVGSFYPAGTITDLEAKFGRMHKKGKSPFNFQWTPFIDAGKKVNQGNLFRTLSDNDRSTIELRVQIFDDAGTKHPTHYWNFYDVGVIRIRPNQKNEIVETHYGNFGTGSIQP